MLFICGFYGRRLAPACHDRQANPQAFTQRNQGPFRWVWSTPSSPGSKPTAPGKCGETSLHSGCCTKRNRKHSARVWKLLSIISYNWFHNVLCQNDPIELKDEMAVATFGGLTSSLYLLHSSNMAGDGPPRSQFVHVHLCQGSFRSLQGKKLCPYTLKTQKGCHDLLWYVLIYLICPDAVSMNTNHQTPCGMRNLSPAITSGSQPWSSWFPP